MRWCDPDRGSERRNTGVSVDLGSLITRLPFRLAVEARPHVLRAPPHPSDLLGRQSRLPRHNGRFAVAPDRRWARDVPGVRRSAVRGDRRADAVVVVEPEPRVEVQEDPLWIPRDVLVTQEHPTRPPQAI